jgi:hypothetical protein
MGLHPHMEGKPTDDAERDPRADQLRCQGQEPDNMIRIRSRLAARSHNRSVRPDVNADATLATAHGKRSMSARRRHTRGPSIMVPSAGGISLSNKPTALSAPSEHLARRATQLPEGRNSRHVGWRNGPDTSLEAAQIDGTPGPIPFGYPRPIRRSVATDGPYSRLAMALVTPVRSRRTAPAVRAAQLLPAVRVPGAGTCGDCVLTAGRWR